MILTASIKKGDSMKLSWLEEHGLVYSDLRLKYIGSVKFDKEFYDIKTKVISEMLQELDKDD